MCAMMVIHTQDWSKSEWQLVELVVALLLESKCLLPKLLFLKYCCLPMTNDNKLTRLNLRLEILEDYKNSCIKTMVLEIFCKFVAFKKASVD